MAKTHDVPEATLGDRLHTLAKAGIASIPVVGAAASELFNVIIAPPLEKRRVEWMNDLAEQLKELEERGDLKLDDLQNNETFITTVMQASQAAIRNHQSEKREALRNAVLNAALPEAPEDSLQQYFINLVDTFTVWHIRLLDLFKDPSGWFEKNSKTTPNITLTTSIAKLITAAWPELEDRHDFFDIIVQELETKGLYSGRRQPQGIRNHRVSDEMITDMGHSFLEFITDP